MKTLKKIALPVVFGLVGVIVGVMFGTDIKAIITKVTGYKFA